MKTELFERFERRILGEFALASAAGDKIDRFPHGHSRPKIQTHSAVITDRTGDFSQPIRDVRLRPELELHIGIYGEAVNTLPAHTPPFAVRLHESLIDAEIGLLADRALGRAEPSFDLLDRG